MDANGNVAAAKKATVTANTAQAREAARVKAGHLSALSRLVLFTPELPEGESNHFSVVAVSDVRQIPSSVSAMTKLSDLDRCVLHMFEYTDGKTAACKSCVFARVEESKYYIRITST